MSLPEQRLSEREFIPLTALVISLVALSIDAMLPALPNIGRDLELTDINDAQLIIGVVLLAMGLGTLVFGPMSDSFGRKPTIYIGFAIFIGGTLTCTFATSFEMIMMGRALQGLGCAAPRIVMMAIVRDQYSGDAMARIMSFVMSVFILVPAIAPAIGQGLMLVFDWRAIFVMLLAVAIIAALWLGIRQPETHPPEKRRPFRLAPLWVAFREVIRHRVTVGYTVAAGFIFAPFIGFLSSCQQVFAGVYGQGDNFPYLFGILALAIGSASAVNGKLVLRWGMRRLLNKALSVATVAGLVFAGYALLSNSPPGLPMFMAYFLIAFFCNGMLFSNLNAIAMEPLGKVAGMGAAVINALSTLISVPLGAYIGHAFDGTIIPLVGSFAAFTCLCGLTVIVTESKSSR